MSVPIYLCAYECVRVFGGARANVYACCQCVHNVFACMCCMRLRQNSLGHAGASFDQGKCCLNVTL